MQHPRVTGAETHWSRDFALIGGVTSLVAPALAMPLGVSALYVAAAALTGLLSGGLLGAAMPRMLDGMRGRVPLGVIFGLGGPVLGALWGASVGSVAYLVGHDFNILLSVGCASLAGAIQFGLCWFPYTFQTVRGGPRWPVVLAACLATPLVGIATVLAVFAVLL